MIESASQDYGYATDDRLNDALSAIMTISNGVGEILGPLCGGVLVNFFDFEDVSAAFGFSFLAYGLYYLIASGYLSDRINKTKPLSTLDMTLKSN